MEDEWAECDDADMDKPWYLCVYVWLGDAFTKRYTKTEKDLAIINTIMTT